LGSFGGTGGEGGRGKPSLARTYRHAAYGIVVDCPFRLTSIEETAAASGWPAITITLGTPDYFRVKSEGLEFAPDDWFHHSVLPDGSIYMKADEIFEAVVSAEGRQAICAKADGVDEKTFEACFLNFILSTSLALQGEEPLHATVVDLGGRAVGLLGDSGAGKSTLAAFLVSQGADLITDDMLRLTFADGCAVAHRGPRRLKLFGEAARRLLPGAIDDGHWNTMSGKIMVQPRSQMTSQRPVYPLSALFWLGEPGRTSAGDAVSSTRLAGVELAQVLTTSAMNIRYRAPDRLARQLLFAEHVARVVPVYALRYARRYALLEQVARAVREGACS